MHILSLSNIVTYKQESKSDQRKACFRQNWELIYENYAQNRIIRLCYCI